MLEQPTSLDMGISRSHLCKGRLNRDLRSCSMYIKGYVKIRHDQDPHPCSTDAPDPKIYLSLQATTQLLGEQHR